MEVLKNSRVHITPRELVKVKYNWIEIFKCNVYNIHARTIMNAGTHFKKKNDVSLINKYKNYTETGNSNAI